MQRPRFQSLCIVVVVHGLPWPLQERAVLQRCIIALQLNDEALQPSTVIRHVLPVLGFLAWEFKCMAFS